MKQHSERTLTKSQLDKSGNRLSTVRGPHGAELRPITVEVGSYYGGGQGV
jgi:hypothetical protein